MAKRKRLTVPNPDATPAVEGTQSESEDMRLVDSLPVGIVPKNRLPRARSAQSPLPDVAPRRAPIADVAGEAAATSALQKVASELTAAKTEGRMVQKIVLNKIHADHLSRDRIVVDAEELEALKTSIRKRGQQTPIEVMDIGHGEYGLISGYRRLQAITDLAQEDHNPAPVVLALVRQPDQSSDAYVAMVEENEIRVGLSYFERANIVREAVKAGVFPTETAALNGLFEAVSRSKRSKIKSFLPVVAGLKDALKFPLALTERLGLALSKRCDEDANFALRLRDRLRKSDVQTAEDEAAILSKAAEHGVAEDAPAADRPAAKQPPAQAGAAKNWAATPRAGMQVVYENGAITVRGDAVSQAVAENIASYLRNLG